MNKIEVYPSVGRMLDISQFQCEDIFVNGEYIGTYQPEIWHNKDGTSCILTDVIPKDKVRDKVKECEDE